MGENDNHNNPGRPLKLRDLSRVEEPRANRWVRPIQRFLEIESSGGILLLICTVIALALANISAASYEAYHHFWHETTFAVNFAGYEIKESLLHWVNDALMTLFFFVVGLEIKREIVKGELSDWKKASLPVAAAVGGMVIPAGIYAAIHATSGTPATLRGWGVPMATDIAFVVGMVSLLNIFGKSVPNGLRIMLLSLAIVDDIGAVLVIAVFYTADLATTYLLYGGIGFCVILFFQWINVRPVAIYAIVGAAIWVAFFAAGVHPTVAGVILGLMTPTAAWIGPAALREVMEEAEKRMPEETPPEEEDEEPNPDTMYTLATTARESVSPLERLELSLAPWVGYVIMPLFALANAGVALSMGTLTENADAGLVAFAAGIGLAVGKPVGVVLACWVAVKLGSALPRGVTWPMIVGGGMMAGIGFTMALFIAGLAFKDSTEFLDAAKVGILAGSAVSVIAGLTWLYYSVPDKNADNGAPPESGEVV